MRSPLIALCLIAAPGGAALAQRGGIPTVIPRQGLVITRSVRIARGTWRLQAPASLDSALITIRGDNIWVDFQGAELEGMAPETEPDLAQGVAIRIEGGRNVHVTGARLRGYRFGLIARGTERLSLAYDDFSFTWKPRLYSQLEHESLVDWLSFHHNDKDEWLRYGAGVYLDSVSGGDVVSCKALQGMNGLLLVRSTSVHILGNDFSFNSGLGIGLYRSNRNVILRNRLDYDVRGYSHRFYHRGQDSAGLLMFEQSDSNQVAWNSATHSGDGLFLWAGQSTMDSGTGGANDNVFWENDFSHAPANGMEATFSRNAFVRNRAAGSDYGLWGGYSFESKVVGNRFSGNRTGIAIEHGQDNLIAGNVFDGDTTAIRLWADSIEPSDWGYPRHRDTRSRDDRIQDNVFIGNRVALRVRRSSGVNFARNALAAVDSATVLADTQSFSDGRNTAVRGRPGVPPLPRDIVRLYPSPLGGEPKIPESPLASRDRSAIIVDEWGPYDWKSPKLWPVDSSRATPMRLVVLGPPGRWVSVVKRGVASLSEDSGRVGDTLIVTPAQGAENDWTVALEYTGERTVSPRGVEHRWNDPYRFGWGRFEPAADWTVTFVAWSDSTDPRRHADAFQQLLGGTPLMTRHEPRLDYQWYRPPMQNLPQSKFALEATTSLTLPPGGYTLRTISDDAVRVWVDGRLAIDDWTPHESVADVAPLSGGRHQLKVQYYQVDGWVELRLDVVRGTQRAGGSPGPH